MVQSNDGDTPLIEAMFGGTDHPDVVFLLTQRGSDLNAKGKNGRRALHVAAFVGSVELVQELLEKGADPTAPNDDGDTDLAFARITGNATVEDMLLRATSCSA
jgi:ankyrin repeat protein